MRDISGLVNITGRLRHRLLNNIVYKTGYKRCVLPKKNPVLAYAVFCTL
jgi:hypothetical protein